MLGNSAWYMWQLLDCYVRVLEVEPYIVKLLYYWLLQLTSNLQNPVAIDKRPEIHGRAELEITAGHRPFSDQNSKMTDQVPICLDMNPIGSLLCPRKSYHARTECPTKTQSLFLALVETQLAKPCSH